MRFDEYLQERGIAAVPVDRFDGYQVDVDGPPVWEAVESRPGMQIWIWPEDPCRAQFCANAVLTMHRVSVVLDPAEVFEMLCNEQVQLVPGARERYRGCVPADDGIGIKGVLSSQFDSKVGAIGSMSHTRIIGTEQETFIAQLTLTALVESPVNWTNVRLSVAASAAESDSAEAVAGRTVNGAVGGMPTGIGPAVTTPGGER